MNFRPHFTCDTRGSQIFSPETNAELEQVRVLMEKEGRRFAVIQLILSPKNSRTLLNPYSRTEIYTPAVLFFPIRDIPHRENSNTSPSHSRRLTDLPPMSPLEITASYFWAYYVNPETPKAKPRIAYVSNSYLVDAMIICPTPSYYGRNWFQHTQKLHHYCTNTLYHIHTQILRANKVMANTIPPNIYNSLPQPNKTSLMELPHHEEQDNTQEAFHTTTEKPPNTPHPPDHEDFLHGYTQWHTGKATIPHNRTKRSMQESSFDFLSHLILNDFNTFREIVSTEHSLNKAWTVINHLEKQQREIHRQIEIDATRFQAYVNLSDFQRQATKAEITTSRLTIQIETVLEPFRFGQGIKHIAILDNKFRQTLTNSLKEETPNITLNWEQTTYQLIHSHTDLQIIYRIPTRDHPNYHFYQVKPLPLYIGYHTLELDKTPTYFAATEHEYTIMSEPMFTKCIEHPQEPCNPTTPIKPLKDTYITDCTIHNFYYNNNTLCTHTMIKGQTPFTHHTNGILYYALPKPHTLNTLCNSTTNTTTHQTNLKGTGFVTIPNKCKAHLESIGYFQTSTTILTSTHIEDYHPMEHAPTFIQTIPFNQTYNLRTKTKITQLNFTRLTILDRKFNRFLEDAEDYMKTTKTYEKSFLAILDDLITKIGHSLNPFRAMSQAIDNAINYIISAVILVMLIGTLVQITQCLTTR
jgi:hypothetical protein